MKKHPIFRPRARLMLSALRDIGFESAKANLVPFTVLWSFAGGIVYAYYRVGAARRILDFLAVWQREGGAFAAFVSCGLFCGLIPYIVYRFRGAAGPRRPLATALAQTVWTGTLGIACNRFFELQEASFGSGLDLVTLSLKTAVDQFVWTPLVITPANTLFYFFVGKLGGRRVRHGDLARSGTRFYASMLVMNWIVWIPVIFAVYALPQELQIQILGMVSAVWAVLCREMGDRA
jgi:hypothetical protein